VLANCKTPLEKDRETVRRHIVSLRRHIRTNARAPCEQKTLTRLVERENLAPSRHWLADERKECGKHTARR